MKKYEPIWHSEYSTDKIFLLLTCGEYICNPHTEITAKLEETISHLYKLFLESEGACIDTRSLHKRQIFFALKGDNFNGNLYAENAIKNGALLAVVDEEKYRLSGQYILVENVLCTLQMLAKHHREQFDIPFLGITGSNGKTSTKEIIARVIRSDRKVQFTKGNLNNHIGVPLTLLTIGLDTDFAIIEMGVNHVGEIAFLCELAQPTHGLITNIGSAHIGEFGDRESIIRAKSELFDYLGKNNGIPFINLEDEVLKNMSKRFSNAVTYPNELSQLVSAAPYVNYKDDQGATHTTEMIGQYNYMNIAAAVTIGKYFEIEDPYKLIDGYVSDNNRSQMVELGTNTIILDAYNANPDSIRVALENLAVIDSENKIAILGDMKELGEYSAEQHKKINDFADSLNLDHVFLVGDDFKQVARGENVEAFETIDQLIEVLKKVPMVASTVLIKGSRSMEMEQLTKISQIWN